MSTLYAIGAPAVSDERRYTVKTKSASGKPKWRTAEGTWSYLSMHAATFTYAEADELIKKLVPADESVALRATKEPAP